MLVQLKNITKVIKDGGDQRTLLSDISCTMEDGEVIALVGTSGAGKTALLRILGCLDNASSGEYFLDEKQATLLSEGSLAVLRRKYIGFMGFEPEIIDSMTVAECLEMPLDALEIHSNERKERLTEMLEFIGFSSKGRLLLSKLRMTDKMRVVAARAFIKNPLMVVADEPGKKLFSQESLDLLDLLISLRKHFGGSLVFSTYDPVHLKKADRLFYMRNGKIVKTEDV